VAKAVSGGGGLTSRPPAVPGSTTLIAVTIGDHARVRDARTLLLEYADSLDVDLSFQNFQRELLDFPSSYLPPTGALLVAIRDERLAGSIAMRSLDDEICEMKRLFVRPDFRGLGIGRELATAVMDSARTMGYRRMRLDTLPGMDGAQRLYRSLGFREIDAYYENPIPGTKYLELDLRSD
jgi:ribosomal protein S18 acetylase RimI-like enzyme